jgi:hypothetical protein
MRLLLVLVLVVAEADLQWGLWMLSPGNFFQPSL